LEAGAQAQAQTQAGATLAACTLALALAWLAWEKLGLSSAAELQSSGLPYLLSLILPGIGRYRTVRAGTLPL